MPEDKPTIPQNKEGHPQGGLPRDVELIKTPFRYLPLFSSHNTITEGKSRKTHLGLTESEKTSSLCGIPERMNVTLQASDPIKDIIRWINGDPDGELCASCKRKIGYNPLTREIS